MNNAKKLLKMIMSKGGNYIHHQFTFNLTLKDAVEFAQQIITEKKPWWNGTDMVDIIDSVRGITLATVYADSVDYKYLEVK